MTPVADQVRADEFLHRHLQLTCISALVTAVTVAVVLVVLSLAPAGLWAVGSAAVGAGVLAVVVAALVRHTVRLTLFALRREVS